MRVVGWGHRRGVREQCGDGRRVMGQDGVEHGVMVQVVREQDWGLWGRMDAVGQGEG